LDQHQIGRRLSGRMNRRIEQDSQQRQRDRDRD
jgi:hypothetical protein